VGELAARLSAMLPTGGRVAVGDGAGTPHAAWDEVLVLLDERPDVSVLLGWWFRAPAADAALDAARAKTLVSGFGMRRLIDAGKVGFVPSRLGAAPTLLSGPLRCDVLLTTLRPTTRGFAFSTEVAWERAVIDAGAAVAAVVAPRAPAIPTGPDLEAASVTILLETEAAPEPFEATASTDAQRAVAANVAALVPDGARIQVGPGGLGAAVFEAIERPVAVDTGIVTDPVMGLAARGLLDGPAYAPYVAGSPELYEWAASNAQVDRVEHTHDLVRLSTGRPLVAVNTGLEIDLDGQVNAEVAGGSWVGGIGGQPDFALGASLSRGGLSIMAMAAHRGSDPTLVERLQGPVSTPCYDVDVVVTDAGSADLRGLDRTQRRAALIELWSR